jgi:nucleotide-binding universal stress UspA family protein
LPKRLLSDELGPAEEAATQRLGRLATSLASRFDDHDGVSVRVLVRRGTAATEIARQARVCKAELIVMGRGDGHPLRDAFLGSTAERVVRRGHLPVLVVRRAPRTSYCRPLFALDFDQAAHDALALALQAIPARHPRLSLLHVYDVPFQSAHADTELPEHEDKGWREQYRQAALERVESLVLAAVPVETRERGDGDRVQWKMYVREGSPRMVIESMAAKINADLLILGTHGYAGVSHVFLGTVAGDVLRRVPCDVLAVPPRSE